jgi:putative membrane protein
LEVVKRRPAEELDVDIRFLLANERTLLAWVRTSLALMAGGLAFTQFGGASPVKNIFGIVFIALGAVMSVFGYIRFRDSDNAIRAGHLPAMGKSPLIQVLAVVLFAVLLITLKVTLA